VSGLESGLRLLLQPFQRCDQMIGGRIGSRSNSSHNQDCEECQLELHDLFLARIAVKGK
jgi:hypothetical protein